MTQLDDDDGWDVVRRESFGDFTIVGAVRYLADVQLWEPLLRVSHAGGAFQDFTVPCGPESYRKNSDDALQVGWATARQWLDGGRIPWKAKRV